MKPTKSQIWARNLSKNLVSSYESSAEIEHKGASGDMREHQIIDVLKYLLPQKYAIEKNVLIINADGKETIKFDGAIIDYDNWPKLLATEHERILPIESVKIAFEIKSNLGLTEMSKIYQEAHNLVQLTSQSVEFSTKVVGFSYTCANIKLAFYNFVIGFIKENDLPLLIAVLNVGIMCFHDADGNVSKSPNKSCTPVLLQTKEDTLLVFIYLLTEQFSSPEIGAAIRRYSDQFYSSMEYFKFDDLFVALMKSKPDELRELFKGKLDVNIDDTYLEIKKIYKL